MRLLASFAAVALAASPALADDKTRARTHLKQGKVYADAGQYDEAIAEFQKAYELDKKSQTLFVIANAYYKKQDYKKAIEFFQQYLTVDPNGTYAQQALEFTTIANKALADENAKRTAAEQDSRKRAALARMKQGDAYAQAGAWASAGDEYKAATDSDGDPSHLLAAADAYRKANALDKTRDAYRAYLDKVPLGSRSDEVRTRLAEVTRDLEAKPAASTEPANQTVASAEPAPSEEPTDDVVRSEEPFRRRISQWGVRGAFVFCQATENPYMQDDPSDGLVMEPGIDLGVLVRYDLVPRIALRPELTFSYRSATFDSDMQIDALTIESAGGLLRVPATVAMSTGWFRAELLAGVVVGYFPHTAAHDNVSMSMDVGYRPHGVVGAVGGLVFGFGSHVAFEIRMEIEKPVAGGDISVGTVNQQPSMYAGSVGLAVTFGR